MEKTGSLYLSESVLEDAGTGSRIGLFVYCVTHRRLAAVHFVVLVARRALEELFSHCYFGKRNALWQFTVALFTILQHLCFETLR